MSTGKIILVVAVILLFVYGKVWVLTHPKSAFGILLGGFLLVLSEPKPAA